MTEPVITINGRTLIEPQARAVRAALNLANGSIDVTYDTDRVEEVLAMMVEVGERKQAEKMLTGMHLQRRDRILQLAGIVPEQASEDQIKLATGYASSNMPADEAATRLSRALGAR